MKQIRPKRPLTAILILVLAFCLIFIVACGNTETDPDDKNPGAPGDTVTPGDMTDPDDGVTDDNGGNDGNEGTGDNGGEDGEGDTTDPDDGNESETTETESDFTFTLSATKDHYIVTGYVGEGGAATIPAEYDGLPVKQIDSLGSTTAYKILTLNIPDPVETIGVEAFKFCYSLISVRLPISLTSIGMRAFRHSYNLFEICNDSNIPLTPGSSSNGGVAEYAKKKYLFVRQRRKQTDFGRRLYILRRRGGKFPGGVYGHGYGNYFAGNDSERKRCLQRCDERVPIFLRSDRHRYVRSGNFRTRRQH